MVRRSCAKYLLYAGLAVCVYCAYQYHSSIILDLQNSLDEERVRVEGDMHIQGNDFDNLEPDLLPPIQEAARIPHLASDLAGQALLDYLSTQLQIHHHVENTAQDPLSTVTLTFTNTGGHVVPHTGWAVYFSHNRASGWLAEELSKNTYSLLDDGAFRLTSIQAMYFKLEPTTLFPHLAPQEHHTIVIHGFSQTKTKYGMVYPNWYVWFNGLEPRVLECTCSDSLDFSSGYEPEDGNYFDFLSPAERYEINDMLDTGKASKPVIPTPLYILQEPQHTYITLDQHYQIIYSKNLFNEATYLREKLGLLPPPSTTQPTSSKYIYLTVDPVTLPPGHNTSDYHLPEAYSLHVFTPSMIHIVGATPAGVFYAIQTLLSLSLDVLGDVPVLKVVDAPRFKVRSYMLDVSRHFFGVHVIKNVLDVMAMYKVNLLHLHLTDDQGWRLDIPGLPELTQVGGMRGHTVNETDRLFPFLGSSPYGNDTGSGYYTREEYRDILQYATKRHIQILPELDFPGHSHAAIISMKARFERLRRQGKDVEAHRYVLHDVDDENEEPTWTWGYSPSTINPCIQSTYTFLELVIKALVDMHKDIQPLKMLHLGGDEVSINPFYSSPACTRFLQKHPELTYETLRAYFMAKALTMAMSLGVRVHMWEEGATTEEGEPLEIGGMEPEIVVNPWKNTWNGRAPAITGELVKAGYKVILAHATHLYLGQAQEPDPNERGMLWSARFLDTRRIFTYIPLRVYANMEADGILMEEACGIRVKCVDITNKDSVLGISSSLWSELLREPSHVFQQTLPRLLALAERAWHHAPWEDSEDRDDITRITKQDYAHFASTVGYKELVRLEHLGLQYYLPPVGARISRQGLTVNTAFPGLPIVYSTDHGQTWSPVTTASHLQLTGTVYLATRSYDGQRLGRVVKVHITQRHNS